jgi:hypothetical protein
MRGCATLAVVLLLAAGCPRKTGPSADYAQASARYTQLHADKLDDAFVDPAMDEVVAMLERVPSSSVDAPGAQDLLKAIHDGRAEVQARADALKKDMDVLREPPPPGTFAPSSPSVADSSPVPVRLPIDAGRDAGPQEPYSGMTLADFQRYFGDCFDPDTPVNVVGVGLRDTYALKGYNRCKDALPGFDQRIVVTDRQSVLGVMPKSAVQVVERDAGPPPPPPSPPAPSEADSGA